MTSTVDGLHDNENYTLVQDMSTREIHAKLKLIKGSDADVFSDWQIAFTNELKRRGLPTG